MVSYRGAVSTSCVSNTEPWRRGVDKACPLRSPPTVPPRASSSPAGLHPWCSGPRPSLCLRTLGPVPECRALTGSQVSGGACGAPGEEGVDSAYDPGRLGSTCLLPAFPQGHRPHPASPRSHPAQRAACGWSCSPQASISPLCSRVPTSECARDTGLTATVTTHPATSSKPAR